MKKINWKNASKLLMPLLVLIVSIAGITKVNASEVNENQVVVYSNEQLEKNTLHNTTDERIYISVEVEQRDNGLVNVLFDSWYQEKDYRDMKYYMTLEPNQSKTIEKLIGQYRNDNSDYRLKINILEDKNLNSEIIYTTYSNEI